MPVPQRVPVAREAGYRTDTIGHYRGGQFYAAVHGAHRDDDQAPDWGRERVRWYAFLHLFDVGGNHRRSEISLIGIAPRLSGDFREQAAALLRNEGRIRPACQRDRGTQPALDVQHGCCG